MAASTTTTTATQPDNPYQATRNPEIVSGLVKQDIGGKTEVDVPESTVKISIF